MRSTNDGEKHARRCGRVETSIQLSLGQDRVRPGFAEAGNISPIAERTPVLRTSGVRTVSPTGVLGGPAGASADEGAELLRWLESCCPW